MDLKEDVLGNNSIEDVSWLCQLSESELVSSFLFTLVPSLRIKVIQIDAQDFKQDFLMSLKAIVIQRAKVVKCEELVNNFDLKTLRALGLVVMENLKGKVKDSSDLLDSTKYCESLDKSNLLKLDIGNVMSLEEIESFLYYSKNRYRES
ncbi:hypothetical protein SAY86_017592 [Trapa natans]|uniref:Uncharacterized protein n=1 Tax=Trapa natans TaxID=22666 RepID=A0AAN7LKT2_TRANT|nr:hypothetical protein SAY86_017592 [Trapa natans]